MVTGILRVNGEEKKITLNDVLHAPEIRGRFFLILKINKKGYSTTFLSSQATITKDGIVFAKGQLNGQYYWLSIQADAPSISHIHVTPINTLHA